MQQVSAEQGQLQEAQVQIADLEAEKSSLKDQLAELSQRLESVEHLGDPTANSLATRRLEFRTKELESKLELEQTTRARLEVILRSFFLLMQIYWSLNIVKEVVKLIFGESREWSYRLSICIIYFLLRLPSESLELCKSIRITVILVCEILLYKKRSIEY